jgi:hypothetical protein
MNEIKAGERQKLAQLNHCVSSRKPFTISTTAIRFGAELEICGSAKLSTMVAILAQVIPEVLW